MGRTGFKGQHVLITGGSTGIGLALAHEFVKARAHVTLIARTASKLQQAVEELQRTAAALASDSPRISYQPADVLQPKQVQAAVDAAEAAQGPVDVLVCNAGAAQPGYFHQQGLSDFESAMRLNYLGVVASVQCVYPRMVQRNSGLICLVSSVMGTMGFAGYAAYSASKYAVRGLAECLRNELQGTNVTISVAFPPDTDTPGYKVENETKPLETREISALSTLFPSSQVAAKMVQGMAKRQFILPTPDIGLNLHAAASQGLVPRGVLHTCCSMLIGWLTPLVQSIYGVLFDRISRRHTRARFSDLLADRGTEGGKGRRKEGAPVDKRQ